MQKIAFGLPTALSVLMLAAASAEPVLAQTANSPTPTPTQAFTAAPNGARELRTHMRLVSARAALIRTYRMDGGGVQAASQTWMENPSLMDSSWRLWPSLVDF
jgi:hypothetical protein